MLRVLTYHRIACVEDTTSFDPRLISASPAMFHEQVRLLTRHYHVIGMDEVLESVRTGTPLPPRAVLITFDDAYRDFASSAWPILADHGLPATLFVPTAYPDRPDRAFWWDRLHRAFSTTTADRLETSFAGVFPLQTVGQRRESLRRLRQRVKTARPRSLEACVEELCSKLGEANSLDNGVLGWDELRELAASGVTLAAHTRTHPLLDQLDPAQARQELVGSQQDLRREIGSATPVISYPDGAHGGRVVSIARQAGFVLGFTTRDGLNDLSPDNRLRMNRTNITPRTRGIVFRMRMHPAFARVDAWRHRAPEVRA